MHGLREMKMAFVVCEERQSEKNTSLIKQMVFPTQTHTYTQTNGTPNVYTAVIWVRTNIPAISI